MSNPTDVAPRTLSEKTLSHREITRLLIKICGLFILANALIGLPLRLNSFILALVSFGDVHADSWQAIGLLGASYWGPFAIYVALGLGFLWRSGRIIDVARVGPKPDNVEYPDDLQSIEVMLVAVLGIYFVADGLAEACRLGFTPGIGYSVSGTATAIWIFSGNAGLIAETAAKLVIGSSLFFRREGCVAIRRGIADWVQKARTWPD
jgi:hypothetical protein